MTPFTAWPNARSACCVRRWVAGRASTACVVNRSAVRAGRAGDGRRCPCVALRVLRPPAARARGRAIVDLVARSERARRRTAGVQGPFRHRRLLSQSRANAAPLRRRLAGLRGSRLPADGEIHLTGRVRTSSSVAGATSIPTRWRMPWPRWSACVALRRRVRQPRPGQRHRAPGGPPKPESPKRRTGRHARADRRGYRRGARQPPDEVVLAPPQTVLKTSSGKLRRAACRELYEAGRVGVRGHAAWWQVIRLISGSCCRKRARVTAVAQLLYGIYGGLVFAADRAADGGGC